MAKLLLGLCVQFFIVDSRICLKYRIKVSEITKEVILCEYSRQQLTEKEIVTMKIKSCHCMKFSDSVHKPQMHGNIKCWARKPCKNYLIHISASLSRQPLVKGERSVRNEVNAVMA